jgi:hypothetical protein
MTLRATWSAIALCITLAVTAVMAQSSADDERRAAITALRAINTAENAVRSQSGKYVPLAELLNHGAMARVKPNFAIAGNTFTHAGAQVRLTLSPDATQYVVTVVYAAPTYTAAFSDERGLIYTGKALE